MRVVVIGADACGASAASTIKRMQPDYEVVVLERQSWTSYSACGIPYWLAGETEGPEPLIARTPEQHRANGLDLRTGWEATAIDVAAQRVSARQLAAGTTETFDYDHLVIGTGAVPRRPRSRGSTCPGFTVCRPSTTGWPSWTPLSVRCATPWSSARDTSASRWPRRCAGGASRLRLWISRNSP